jgi:hypothetical protein
MIDQHTQNKHIKKNKKGDSVAILFANKHIEQANTQLWIYPRQKKNKNNRIGYFTTKNAFIPQPQHGDVRIT